MLPSVENPSLTVGEQTYALLPRIRPEMIDSDLQPIKAQLPEPPGSVDGHSDRETQLAPAVGSPEN